MGSNFSGIPVFPTTCMLLTLPSVYSNIMSAATVYVPGLAVLYPAERLNVPETVCPAAMVTNARRPGSSRFRLKKIPSYSNVFPSRVTARPFGASSFSGVFHLSTEYARSPMFVKWKSHLTSSVVL